MTLTDTCASWLINWCPRPSAHSLTHSFIRSFIHCDVGFEWSPITLRRFYSFESGILKKEQNNDGLFSTFLVATCNVSFKLAVLGLNTFILVFVTAKVCFVIHCERHNVFFYMIIIINIIQQSITEYLFNFPQKILDNKSRFYLHLFWMDFPKFRLSPVGTRVFFFN